MATRPSSYLNWTDGANTKVTQPPAANALAGYTPGFSPPAQWVNYQFYTLDQWVQYLDQRSSGGGSGGGVVNNARLLGGGTWTLSATALSWSAAFQVALPGQADSANQVAAGGVTIPDGSVAYVQLNVPIQYSGATTSGSTSLTNLSSINGLSAGMAVSGPGIAAGTTLSSVSGTAAVLSAAATGTNGSALYTFQSSGALTATVAAESNVSAGPQTAIIARNTGGVMLVGVGAVDMLMRDGESRSLRGTGFSKTIQAVAGQSMTQGTVVYVADNTDITPTARTAGYCYPNDTTSNGTSVRSTVAGVLAQNVANGGTATIVVDGVVSGFTGLNPGTLVWANVYLAGGVQQWTPPFISASFKSLVGLAISATQVLVRGGGQDQSMSLNPVFNNVNATNVGVSGQLAGDTIVANSGFRFLAGGAFYNSAQAQGWAAGTTYNVYGPGGMLWFYLAEQNGLIEGLRLNQTCGNANTQAVFKLYQQAYVTSLQNNATLVGQSVGATVNSGGNQYVQWLPFVGTNGLPIPTLKNYVYYIQISSNISVPANTTYACSFAMQVVD